MNDAKVVGNNALVLGAAEPPQIERPEEESKLDRQVSLIEQQASSVVVASEEGFVLAGELTKQVKAMQKQVTDYWEPMRKSTYEAYTAVNQHKKEMKLITSESTSQRNSGARWLGPMSASYTRISTGRSERTSRRPSMRASSL